MFSPIVIHLLTSDIDGVADGGIIFYFAIGASSTALPTVRMGAIGARARFFCTGIGLINNRLTNLLIA